MCDIYFLHIYLCEFCAIFVQILYKFCAIFVQYVQYICAIFVQILMIMVPDFHIPVSNTIKIYRRSYVPNIAIENANFAARKIENFNLHLFAITFEHTNLHTETIYNGVFFCLQN